MVIQKLGMQYCRGKGGQENFCPLPGKQYVHIFIKRGRAFLDYLVDKEDTSFVISLIFAGKKLQSQPCKACCDPIFDQGFVFEVDGFADCEILGSPLGMRIIFLENKLHSNILLSSTSIDLRDLFVMKIPSKSYPLELPGLGHESLQILGMLELTVSLVPSLMNQLSESTLTTIREIEKMKWNESFHLFLMYVKSWHQEFISISVEHSYRNVCVLAVDELGRKRDLCSFITPLFTGRLIETPSQALWYVSLIPEEKRNVTVYPLVCFSSSQFWCSIDALLAKKTGTCMEHDILLCSILLGFKLETYVYVGENKSFGIQSGVLSISSTGDHHVIILWDWKSGCVICYNSGDDNNKLDELEIHCLFSHCKFFANIQVNTTMRSISWDLKNEGQWKALNRELIAQHDAMYIPAQLSPASLDDITLSNTLEGILRKEVVRYRESLELPTSLDPQLSYTLGVALAHYESASCLGHEINNQEVNECVYNCVRPGHMFMGYPHHFRGILPNDILQSCLESEECLSIVQCHNDQTHHGVRVRVYSYPENILSIWVMIACCCVQ